MTRAMCSRTSKRKYTKPSQEVVQENYKENSPPCTSLMKTKRKQVQSFSDESSKGILPLGSNLKNSVTSNNNGECLRKSVRQRISSFNNKDYFYNVSKCETKAKSSGNRNVLSDKTNSPMNREDKSNKEYKSFEQISNKSNNLTNIVNPHQENNVMQEKCKSKTHTPVYKTVHALDITTTSCKLPLEKKGAIYEFDEVDENEEPVKKKKRKKRTNIKKPRIGPKALTINNIKYSSTESLVSLPENTARQKKTKTKTGLQCLKPSRSVSNLNESESTCYSVQSFMSHPPSLLRCDKKGLKNKKELSVLQETQSEECHNSIHTKRNTLSPVENQSEIMVSHLNSDPVNNSVLLPQDSRSFQDSSVAFQQRCYRSKKSLSSCTTGYQGMPDHFSINDTLPNQVSQCSANNSTASRDFLSSTPCKRTSLVVRNNSVFDDSCEKDIPVKLRPSTGFIKNVSESVAVNDNCFGFDEPEELEEPLVSPIKNINLPQPRLVYCPRNELFSDGVENAQPDVKEVIAMLKSTIPEAQTKESSVVFNPELSPSELSNTSSHVSEEIETSVRFIKPPRRSYERQRRVRYYSEHEEDDEERESDDNEKEKELDKQHRENVLKAAKKCYQKKNISKVFKAPKVTKAKLKLLKEEEELERLAAQMNAQFQEIEKCNLVVE